MDRDAIDAFLGEGGTGVLSLANADTPYAIPVSYGYDATAQEFYFRLSDQPHGRKWAFIAEAATGCLVVYDRVDGEWVSVVASGELAEMDDDALTGHVASVLRQADLPLTELVDVPGDEIDYRIVRLDAETVTGRSTARD